VTLPPTLLSILDPDKFPKLRTIISAGESCTNEIADRWSDGKVFINAYGPTEVTIGPTYYRYQKMSSPALTVPIGKPINNIQIYILDKNKQPVPIGIPGEIFIGGAGVAKGYLNRPELTEEKFIPNPFYDLAQQNKQTWASTHLYRTGDLGRFLPDKNIEFLGRVDFQVKIRGFRIELGEIEGIIEQNPLVRQVVVLAREDEPGVKKLVAYIVPEKEQELKISELRRAIRAKLPEYMVPSTFILMEEFPLNTSGKIDRNALPPPTSDHSESDIAFVSPKTDLERTIATIWGQVLNVERVGLNDNFFDLGGHSLLVAKAHSQLQDTLSREFSLINLFRYPTVSALAEFLSGDASETVSLKETIERADKQKESLKRQSERLKKLAENRFSFRHQK
jgi:hypothetical protein